MCILINQASDPHSRRRKQTISARFFIWLCFDYLSHRTVLSTMKFKLSSVQPETLMQVKMWDMKAGTSRSQSWRSHLISVSCQIWQALSLSATIRTSAPAIHTAPLKPQQSACSSWTAAALTCKELMLKVVSISVHLRYSNEFLNAWNTHSPSKITFSTIWSSSFPPPFPFLFPSTQ